MTRYVTNLFGELVLDEQGNPKPVKLFNHTTTDYGKWVDYNGMRFKDVYSLRLKDGTVIERARPNGNSWYAYTEPTVSQEEAARLEAAGAQIPRTVIPETPLCKNGRYEDEVVAQIRLVPEEEFSYESWGYTGIERILHNRRLFAGFLSPDEDLTIGVPLAAKAKFLQFGVWETRKTKGGGESSKLAMVDYIATEPWTQQPDFVKDGVLFRFEQTVTLKLNGISMQGPNVPKVMRLFFQQGGELEIDLPIHTEVTEGDRTGEFLSKPTSVKVTKVPARAAAFDWAQWFENNPLHGHVRFTFYYPDQPSKGAADDLENPQTTQ